MADRYRTASGWSVEVVERSGTPDHSDGQQLRVRYHGFYVADVRTVAELEQYFPLADLEPDGLSVAATRRPAGSRRAPVNLIIIVDVVALWLPFRLFGY
jgi:hypothetical protein